MIDQTENYAKHKEIRKPYCKPEITQVKLVPEEATLGTCKDGAAASSCDPDFCAFTAGS